ncbi:MAG: hypothetical protein Q9M31_01450 [Mariprofundus sp.]|nr:hypothetical protein [Mariprofundus sp.]
MPEIQRLALGDDESPRSEKQVFRCSLDELKGDRVDRGEWMAIAYRENGYTMREIAAFASVHYSLVSRLIKGWEDNNSTFKT